MSMKRVVVQGKTLNRRTEKMLNRAQARLGLKFDIMQGSYNAGGVSASAGTHDGGGAVDIRVIPDRNNDVIRALREVGFAAWHRLPSQGPWVEHNHAIAIGDPEMSSGAHTQVVEYYAGQNGLANHAADDGPRLNPVPTWPVKLGNASSLVLKHQLQAKHPKSRNSVKLLQRSLARKLKREVVVDGVAGSQTRQAFRAWQKHEGFDTSKIDRKSLRSATAGYARVL